MSTFEIRQKKDGTISGILPATAYPIGTPLMISGIDNDTEARTFVLAEGRCDGFMTRASRATRVRTDEEILFPNASLETPFLAGAEGSIDTGVEELTIEGADYLKLASTGLINASTAAGTLLSFEAGKFYVAAEGDYAQWIVLDSALTPETEDAIRIRVKRIDGGVVPAAA